ncbi:MAG: FlgD immunoglobulin-like domain containing protein, partial [bacterium]
CLIPCRGISTLSTDHVWNEFWDEQWEQWEPVNNSHKNKMAYSGRKYGTVFARRSDGIVEWVTKEYEKTGAVATLNLTVNDNNNKPIDGAIVILFVRNLDDPNNANLDSYTITDNDGKCSFLVGTTREFFCRVISEYGNYPPTSNQVALLKSFPDSGQTYNLSCKVAGSKELAHVNTIEPPADDLEDFIIEAEYNVINQVVNWDVAFDDFDGYFSFYKKDNGKVNFYISDIDQYLCCNNKAPFDACMQQLNSTSMETILFNFPLQIKSWVLFTNNGNCSRNFNIVDATFKLRASPTVKVEEKQGYGNIISYSAYPNPFTDLITFNFNLQNNANVELNIFSIEGELVKSYPSKILSSGSHHHIWDGTDDNNNPINNGVYYYQLNVGNHIITDKIVFIR